MVLVVVGSGVGSKDGSVALEAFCGDSSGRQNRSADSSKITQRAIFASTQGLCQGVCAASTEDAQLEGPRPVRELLVRLPLQQRRAFCTNSGR